MTSRDLKLRTWLLATLIAAAIAVVFDALGPSEVGTIRAAVTAVCLAPGLVVLLLVNGFNPHFDLTGPDHILLVLVTALFWGTAVLGVTSGINWLRRRAIAVRSQDIGPPPAA